MRLTTFQNGGTTACGLVRDGRVHATADLAAAGLLHENTHPGWSSVRGILGLGERAWEALASIPDGMLPDEGRSLDGLTVLAPIPDPQKIVCLGLNYRDHAEEVGAPIPEVPIIFGKFANSLTGFKDPIVLPAASDAVDFEAELAVVVGKRVKSIRPDQALAAVAGIMPLNDVTARDLQFRTSQWMLGKAIDTFAPCGPELVFLDEVGDLQALALITRVNGHEFQAGNTANMIFSITEIVSYLSQLMTLEPGDIIATGTPSGVGMGRTPPVSLHSGDVVEVEIPGVGTLRNPVQDADSIPA